MIPWDTCTLDTNLLNTYRTVTSPGPICVGEPRVLNGSILYDEGDGALLNELSPAASSRALRSPIL